MKIYVWNFFSKYAIVAEPFLDDMSEEIKMLALCKRNEILFKVKDF